VGVTVDTNLLSCIVHELVVRATEYFPVSWEGGMWNEEVARRVTISISYFYVVDAHPVSRRGLDLFTSAIYVEMTGHCSMDIPRPPIRRPRIRWG